MPTNIPLTSPSVAVGVWPESYMPDLLRQTELRATLLPRADVTIVDILDQGKSQILALTRAQALLVAVSYLASRDKSKGPSEPLPLPLMAANEEK